jgi:pentatricopeptide repeat protein
MIDAYSKSGSIERAIEVFDSMKKDGIAVVTYRIVVLYYPSHIEYGYEFH